MTPNPPRYTESSSSPAPTSPTATAPITTGRRPAARIANAAGRTVAAAATTKRATGTVAKEGPPPGMVVAAMEVLEIWGFGSAEQRWFGDWCGGRGGKLVCRALATEEGAHAGCRIDVSAKNDWGEHISTCQRCLTWTNSADAPQHQPQPSSRMLKSRRRKEGSAGAATFAVPGSSTAILSVPLQALCVTRAPAARPRELGAGGNGATGLHPGSSSGVRAYRSLTALRMAVPTEPQLARARSYRVAKDCRKSLLARGELESSWL
jgi:hypothetical protein